MDDGVSRRNAVVITFPALKPGEIQRVAGPVRMRGKESRA
jgi:hypothetical protein